MKFVFAKLRSLQEALHVNCEYCGKIFQHWSELRVHVAENHTMQSYVSPLAMPTFSSQSLSSIAPQSAIICNYCGLVFHVQDDLRIHLTTFHGMCHVPTTPNMLSVSTPTIQHPPQNSLQEDQVHICNVCGKTFPTMDKVKDHERTHTCVKSHECCSRENIFHEE